jgi:hypothetical protein
MYPIVDSQCDSPREEKNNTNLSYSVNFIILATMSDAEMST